MPAEEPANLPALHPQLCVQGCDAQSHRPLAPQRVAPRGLSMTPLVCPITEAVLDTDSLGKALRHDARAVILGLVPSLLPARGVLVVHQENRCGIRARPASPSPAGLGTGRVKGRAAGAAPDRLAVGHNLP